jgi:hypothetical protein
MDPPFIMERKDSGFKYGGNGDRTVKKHRAAPAGFAGINQ